MVRFKQFGTSMLATMHWGIFVAEPNGDLFEEDIPNTGFLFHASGDCLTCLAPCTDISNETKYRAPEEFRPHRSKNFHDFLFLSKTSTEVDKIHQICRSVTSGRDWNMITSNCQVWVKQIVSKLIDNGHIPPDALEKMETNNWKTLPEQSTDMCGIL